MPTVWSDPIPLPDAFGDSPDQVFHYDDSFKLLQRDENSNSAKPLVELEMTRLSAALRMKPSWWIKCHDKTTLSKWRAEAIQQAELMTESHVDYVLTELDGYAKLRDESSGAEVSCYDRIWQSDTLSPPSLRDRLIAGVSKLESVPDSEKDWHPRSNGQVLDLVHPSLYPIVYGRTLAYPDSSALHDSSKLSSIRPPKLVKTDQSDREIDYFASRRFQWLPTDFQVSEDGKSVKSLGYINNLHPSEHAALHSAIEELVGAYLPLFERVLTDCIPKNSTIPQRVTRGYSYDEEYEPIPSAQEFADDDQYDQGYREWENGRPHEQPEVKAEGYVPGSLEQRELWYSLGGRSIQVIVKLANIHLTPDNPKYKGGSWHIEGMMNESISASGIHYYNEDNITESRLAFRTSADSKRAIPAGGLSRMPANLGNIRS